MIPYGKQTIDDDDIQAVIDVLKSDWLTTGPKVDEFEEAIASFVNNKYSVAVSSGTAALHCAMFAAGIKQDDEVITTPMTFAASSNAILYMGAMPVFVDIEENTLLIDASKIEEKVDNNDGWLKNRDPEEIWLGNMEKWRIFGSETG